MTAAEEVLDRGGRALGAVEAAVIVLEDAPEFNAGRGSVPTAAGPVEMDAGLMCGKTQRAGAVGLVSITRNPIVAARLVLEDGRHVMLAGTPAEDFAARRGARLEDPGYFLSGRGRTAELGTVGAVVCDDRGDVAAGTSTGGTRGQLPGRIGDSPIVGAGVYAENASCAVSCTGTGELIMRAVLAHRIACAAELGATPSTACDRALRGPFADLGGAGGAIAVDPRGRVGMCFNTTVMHRAWKVGREETQVASA